jgi:hypothetical protein
VNRETLDDIVKQGLVKYADTMLSDIGECVRNEEILPIHIADAVIYREDALALLRDDARRLKIVDRILKEMKP